MKAPIWIWQFDKDYPGSEADDSKLPISQVLVKATDGPAYMARFDPHPSSIAGPQSVRNLAQIYKQQGIDLALWSVIYSATEKEASRLVELAEACGTIVLDIEPGWWVPPPSPSVSEAISEMCDRLKAARPDINIGLCYDPRYPVEGARDLEDKPARINFGLWLPHVDSLWPMCYFDAYAGQGGWGQPAECVRLALAGVGYVGLPVTVVLPGQARWPDLEAAFLEATATGADVSFFRRGLVKQETWDGLAALAEPAPPEPDEPDPDLSGLVQRVEALERVVGEHESRLGDAEAWQNDTTDLIGDLHERLGDWMKG